jgi:hypothetical protein
MAMLATEIDKGPDEIRIGYLLLALCTALLALGGVWTYTETRGMHFLESGYPVWKAKHAMLHNCDLGKLVVFGDSRADSSVIPQRLPVQATNMGLAGSTPLENYFYVKSGVGCKQFAGSVMLSFSPGAFEIVQPWLWDNAVRYGILGWTELSQIRDNAALLKDDSYANVRTQLGMTGLLRDLLYAARFPAVYFNSLVEGRILQRFEQNQAKFLEVQKARGYPTYGKGALHGMDEAKKAFKPLPLQKFYFERTVRMLDKKGVDMQFLITPMNAEAAQSRESGYLRGYMDYLQGLAKKYPHFHLLQESVPVWSGEYFGDGIHLNRAGAEKLSDGLAACMEPDGKARTGCTLAKL